MIEWASPYAEWVYVALGLGVVATIVVARRIAIADRLRRRVLFVPRFLLLSLLLVVLLNPVQRHEHHLPPRPAQIHFLIDSSRSMALDRPLGRLARVRQTIARADELLDPKTRPRLQLFRFGRELASISDLAQLQSNEDSTRLAMALSQLPTRFTKETSRGVVVFSDGVADDREKLSEVVEIYRQLRIPIHVFPVGNQNVVGDIAIDELVVPPRVDVGVKAPVRGVVRSAGYEGERVVVQVVPAHRKDVTPLASLPITLGRDPVPFEIVVDGSDDLGEMVLEVPPLVGEATEDNNRVPFQITRTGRQLKVIYMEGTGNNEYRWVRDALQEDREIQCLAMVADQQYVQRPRLVRVDDSLRGFPSTREELLEYDCVICSDISLGAFTREQLDWTVELVAKQGGGFAMVGGITSFGAGSWDQTAWDQLIPIDMAGGRLGRGYVYHTFRVRIPEDAITHPIWHIVDDPVQNRRVLAAMPPFHGTNYMERLKPAAKVLANSETPIPSAGIMTVMAAQAYGRGRTFAFAPDTTFDWGRDFESQWGEGDNRYFRRFWRNVVHWLCENSVTGNKRLQLETDRVVYRAGQEIQLIARAFDEKLRPTIDYELMVQVSSPDSALSNETPITETLLPSSVGMTYHATLDTARLLQVTDSLSGASSIAPRRELTVIATQQGNEVSRSTIKVSLLPDVHELLEPQPRPDTLTSLAASTGGRVLKSELDLFELLKGVPNLEGDPIVSRQPLWDHPLVWSAMIVLLVVEWTLRKLL